MPPGQSEQSPLLGGERDERDRKLIEFGENDEENPRAWSRARKLTNIAVIASMAIMSPLASSMFTPGISQIAEDLNTTTDAVIATTAGFVVMLGIGPLILAPLSETFGRRKLYLICFTIFTLLQIPTALSPNIEFLITIRTISGFFGSVGIANGGGTVSDMFEPHERSGVFGWYLLGPLMGPTLGPLIGGVIVSHLAWRWIYWILAIMCAVNTLAGYMFLKETYAPVILSARKARAELDDSAQGQYHIPNEDTRPLSRKIASSLTRPPRIFIQPIVLTMSIYQALIFGTTYSIYTNMQDIYGKQYGFNSEQVGLLYLFPGIGFLIAVRGLVPRVDDVYNALAKRNKGEAKPEYRLPLANIGAVLLPISLFWFAWTVEFHAHWAASIVSTFFYGVGQVIILNTVQNYYIDAFEKYAASAIAAGAVFRSVVGGIVPILAPPLFRKVGYGWGISVFGSIALALAPAPVLFYVFGERIRMRVTINLD